jgi:hypothetical protein
MAAIMTVDYAALLRDLPAGAWVAISESQNKVLAYAAEAREALEKAREQGEHDPILVRVPDQAATMFL